ncbi:hypothetical protein [Novilysobacter luteus]|jgi:hypothetical protein|uniref:Uncharacterized protein n=1 Tax=Novilysobacter luteus TaxID=2822368 RepID=A0ABM8UCA0_9GAMM|nr:hypothetical protein [Lysobacter luteus]CAG4968502.1 hypothetical protein LYB30171_00286 [Lysobacter luteus]
MKIKNEITKPKDERMAKLQRQVDLALSMKAPSVETTFSATYELIEIALNKGLSQKEVIALVNETYDLKLHSASFRTLLKNERDVRLAGGSSATCPTCGHSLTPCASPDSKTLATENTTEISPKEVA